MARLISVFFLLVFYAQTACALEIKTVEVGIDGYYKNGFWTPVAVSWVGEHADQVARIELETVDSDGTPVRTESDVKASRSNETFRATAYVKLGRNTGAVTVRLCSADAVLTEKRILPALTEAAEIRGTSRKTTGPDSSGVLFLSPVPQERPILLVLAANDAGLQDAVGMLRLKETRRPILVMIDSLDKFPRNRRGLDAVELICLTNSVPGMWEGTTSKDARILAMVQWMKLGGHVLFAPGGKSESLLTGEDAPLKPFLPGRFERMATLRQGKPLELFTDSNRAIQMDGSEVAPFLEMPFLAEPQGTLVLAEADLPLIIRKPCGFGMLTYFGADLTAAPLSDWRQRGQFVSKLLDWGEAKSKGTTVSQALIHPGYRDLSGQIRSALDRFDGVTTIPFSLIMVLIAVYTLLIGPVDWFFVHRVLKKPRLTWITFPCWIVLFCWIATALGYGHRTQAITVNSVDLIDMVPSERLVRISTWGDVYSPKDGRYDLTLASGETSKKDHRELYWLGLSGRGLGGMEPQTVSLNLWDQPYEYRDAKPDALKGVPIRVRSTKSFFGQEIDGLDGDVSDDAKFGKSFQNVTFKQADGFPVGTLTNDLPVDLEYAVLVYKTWVFKLGRIESGKTITVGNDTIRRELRMLLNTSRAGFEDDLYAVPGRQKLTFDTQSQDVWPILRTMTFFKTFGGYDSIGLHNTLHPNLDWSELLAADRAIFVALVDSSDDEFADQLRVQPSETDQPIATQPGCHTTVVRIVFPVENR